MTRDWDQRQRLQTSAGNKDGRAQMGQQMTAGRAPVHWTHQTWTQPQ
eukprot:CAMPEP_0206149878 /NCGR_PEP_ID=MMETSP1473-20131121/38012_1 /ASSEMBLY_ACC=CAM_ASM_001109 /TAXON_ID=1461547 /ORGANISM="Stichococcus sp, Strain RCC1054" /LENGTH=46 /DNA_ID= /DNA_START= /DNA_END= /DNA_ORIENTATION=